MQRDPWCTLLVGCLNCYRLVGCAATDCQLPIDVLKRGMSAGMVVKLVRLGGHDEEAQPQSEHHEHACNAQVH